MLRSSVTDTSMRLDLLAGLASAGWSGRWPLRAAETRSRDRGSPQALSDDDAGIIGIG